MIYSNVFEFLKTFYSTSDLEQLNHCKQIQEDDAGDLVYKNLECILNGLRKIEAQTGNASNNEVKEKQKIETNNI